MNQIVKQYAIMEIKLAACVVVLEFECSMCMYVCMLQECEKSILTLFKFWNFTWHSVVVKIYNIFYKHTVWIIMNNTLQILSPSQNLKYSFLYSNFITLENKIKVGVKVLCQNVWNILFLVCKKVKSYLYSVYVCANYTHNVIW